MSSWSPETKKFDSPKSEPPGRTVEKIILGIIGIILIIVIGWGSWEKRRQNDLMYVSPDEQLFARERGFYMQLGQLEARLDQLTGDITHLKSLAKNVGSVEGKIDTMKAYFEKYSPDNFERKLNEVYKSVADTKEQFVFAEEKFDEKYMKTTDSGNYVRQYEFREQINSLANLIREVSAKLEEPVEIPPTVPEPADPDEFNNPPPPPDGEPENWNEFNNLPHHAEPAPEGDIPLKK